MIKSLKALAIAFWHVCKQLPGFFVERFEAYADEMEHINELRGRGEHAPMHHEIEAGSVYELIVSDSKATRKDRFLPGDTITVNFKGIDFFFMVDSNHIPIQLDSDQEIIDWCNDNDITTVLKCLNDGRFRADFANAAMVHNGQS